MPDRAADISVVDDQKETSAGSSPYAILDNILEGAQIIGHDWRYIYLNKAIEAHSKRPNRELLGKVFTEAWPGIEHTEVYASIRRCLESGVSRQLENHFEYPDGRSAWFELRIQRVPEGAFILSLDITARKEAEAVLQTHQDELEEKVQARTKELRRIVDLMAGRENRMMELKNEITDLKKLLRDYEQLTAQK